jgi:hypothetical protein
MNKTIPYQIIQRTKGETRKHLYDYSMGYPIRVCNWTIPENDFTEDGDVPFCKYCQSYLDNKRRVCFAPKPHSF